MATMPLSTLAELVDALMEHQLLEPAQLDEVIRVHQKESDGPSQLVQKLVERGWLTAFQGERLLASGGSDLVLGPYRLVQPLGEGGMGQVFKAKHQRLGRLVALKIIRHEHRSQDPEAVRRFQREARAAAQLSHPNIVIVYDADQIDNTYFIAMEYVDGTDLSRRVKEQGPLEAAEACDYIRQAALGLQHAFERGMVHRDIKPSNLLVTRSDFGQSSAWGMVKILDMGLVRLVRSADAQATNTSLTREGSVMGTPDYIAPEQARNAHRVDIRADIYSLGCTLYYLLTGRPPFPEGSVIEKLLMHQLDEPEPIEALRPRLPAELVQSVRKMMAKKPEDRYSTPAEVAQTMSACALAAREVGSAAAATGLGESTTATAIVPAVPAGAPAEQATEMPATPTTVPAEQATEMPAAPTEPAAASLLRPERGPVVVSSSKETTPSPGAQSEAATAVGSPLRPLAILKGHDGWVTALTFGRDRNTLAAASIKGQVHLWDFGASKPRVRDIIETHLESVHALAFSQETENIRMLATGSGAADGVILIWDLSEEKAREKALIQRHQAPVETMAFSADGRLLASGGDDQTVRVFDLSAVQPKEKAVLKGHTGFVQALLFSPDGKTLWSAGQDGVIRCWSAGRLWWAERDSFQAHRGPVYALCLSPDGKLLASAGQDQAVRLWDVSEVPAQPRTRFAGHTGVPRLVQFTGDGQSVVSVDSDAHALQWDIAAASPLHDWLLPRVMVYSYTITHDGRYLATGTHDGNVLVYRLGSKKTSPLPAT
jgi:serine/threonine-protein kinase